MQINEKKIHLCYKNQISFAILNRQMEAKNRSSLCYIVCYFCQLLVLSFISKQQVMAWGCVWSWSVQKSWSVRLKKGFVFINIIHFQNFIAEIKYCLMFSYVVELELRIQRNEIHWSLAPDNSVNIDLNKIRKKVMCANLSN